MHEVAAGFGVRLDEAADAGCCGHPSRGSVSSLFASAERVCTACPACDAGLAEAGVDAVPLWDALTERAARAPGIALRAAGGRFVPYVGCLADRNAALAALGDAAEQSGAHMAVDYPTLHNGCCGALGGMYRGATKSSARLLGFAAGQRAPVVTTCILCRDNLRSAARELKLAVPVRFWPEFFRAVPAELAGTAVPSAPEEPAMPDAKDNPYAHIAGDTFTATPRRDPELVRRILDDPRMHDHKDGFQSCIQCGVCTSGCPAARFTEYSPRETARRALDGDVTLLEDDTLWYCYYCSTCQSRCPRHNSVAVINQVIRGMQVESGRGRRHVAMFAEWCGNFYEKGMGGDPHLMFPAIGEAWGEKWIPSWSTCWRCARSSGSATFPARACGEGSADHLRGDGVQRAPGGGERAAARRRRRGATAEAPTRRARLHRVFTGFTPASPLRTRGG